MTRNRNQKTLSQMAVEAVAKVGHWNESNPVGIAVTVTKDDGSTVDTVTTSQAWEASCCALVKLSGFSGGYSLDRVKVKQ